MASETITANSSIVWCFWSTSGDCWNCQDLINYHKALVAKSKENGYDDKYALENANTTFLTEWEKGPFINSQVSCRSMDSAFRKYAKDNGFLDALFGGIGVLGKPIGVTGDVIDAAGHIVSDTAAGAETAAKYLKFLIPIGLIIVAIALSIWGLRKAGVLKTKAS